MNRELFEDLEILEKWYKKGILLLEDYFKLKSSIVDWYREQEIKKNDEDYIPF